jgi:hypothetical protein
LTVIDDIKNSDEAKNKLANESIAKITKLLNKKRADYGPVSEFLDLAFAATRYQEAPIPGGEAQACARVLSKVIRIMTLRATELLDKKLANTDSLEDSMDDLLGEALRFHSEIQSNRNQR